MFGLCAISLLLLISIQTSHTGSKEVLGNCFPDINISFGVENKKIDKLSSSYKLAHAEVLSYDKIASAFSDTASLALKLAGKECRRDICSLASSGIDVRNVSEIAVAVTALTNMPYGLRLLLCSDSVTVRSVIFGEILYVDKEHGNKVQTARTKPIENEAYMWQFEPVDIEKRLQFRIRNAQANQYLRAERKFSMLNNNNLRRIVYTDSESSDIWEVKMMSNLNGKFNRFMILNLNLGEYLYASRGFCYDNVTDVEVCETRPVFTWEYNTVEEAEEDEYNKFVIDEFTLGL